MTVFRGEDGHFISYDTYIEQGGSVEWITYPHEREEAAQRAEPIDTDIDYGDGYEDYDSMDFDDEDHYP